MSFKNDQAVLRLIRMWLDFGVMSQDQSSLKRKLIELPTLLDRTADFMSELADSAIDRLLTNKGYYGYQSSLYDSMELSSIDKNEAHKQLRKEALMRLGRDGALLLLTSYKGIRKILTKKSLMIAGPVFLSLAVIPTVSKAVAKRWKYSTGIIQGGPISPWWTPH